MPRAANSVGRSGTIGGESCAWLEDSDNDIVDENEDSGNEEEEEEEDGDEAHGMHDEREELEGRRSRVRQAVQKQVQTEGSGTTHSTDKRYATFINPKNKWLTVSEAECLTKLTIQKCYSHP